MVDRLDVLSRIQSTLQAEGHIIGISTASGIITKYAGLHRTGFILLSASGLYRNMGLSSLGAFLPFGNVNRMLENAGSQLLRLNSMQPAPASVPLIFGLNAGDPTIDLESYIDRLIGLGYSGINNYPSAGLIDGTLRERMEEEGLGFEREVEAVRIAHSRHFFTVAYAFDPIQAQKMAEAGADVICAHLGLTKGGSSANIISPSIHANIQLTRNIFDAVARVNPYAIRLIYSGPVVSHTDLQYFYNNVALDGYIGGSAFDRIPIEENLHHTITSYEADRFGGDNAVLEEKLSIVPEKPDFVKLTKEYIESHFSEDFAITDIADTLGVSRTRLGELFKKEMGITLSHYIITYRIRRACEIMRQKDISIYEVAGIVGYGDDYAHFSKSFKKHIGISPKEYKKQLFRQNAASEQL